MVDLLAFLGKTGTDVLLSVLEFLRSSFLSFLKLLLGFLNLLDSSVFFELGLKCLSLKGKGDTLFIFKLFGGEKKRVLAKSLNFFFQAGNVELLFEKFLSFLLAFGFL